MGINIESDSEEGPEGPVSKDEEIRTSHHVAPHASRRIAAHACLWRVMRVVALTRCARNDIGTALWVPSITALIVVRWLDRRLLT